MVTVLTGMFEVFSTGGLSAATVQRPEVSDDQISALFWFNMALGLLLAALCLVAAPLLADFYNEPRTAQVLAAMAPFFILTAASVQHSAVLLRQMQHATLSAIEVAAEAVAAVIGIAMALAGWGYWALVASSLALPFVVTIGVWIATGWIPQARCRASGIVPMLHFGGTLTLNNLVVYGGYNAEKLLLGRYFGPDTLGLYSRIDELINLPTRIVNSAFGSVTFAALSRVQTVPARFKRYFLAGYSLVLAITIPTTIFCAVLADDIIIVVLGPKWIEGALIFRLLAPTILVFGIINPTAMLLQSSGLHRRSLNIAFVIAPLADRVVPDRYTLWANRRGARLLDCNDLVGGPTSPVVPARNPGHGKRPSTDDRSPAYRRDRRGRCRNSCATSLRTDPVLAAAYRARRHSHAGGVCLRAPVRDEAKGVLS